MHLSTIATRAVPRSTGEQLVWNIAEGCGVQAISLVSSSTRDSTVVGEKGCLWILTFAAGSTPAPLMVKIGATRGRSRRLATPLPRWSSRWGCAGGDDGGDASGEVLLLSRTVREDSGDISGDAGGGGAVDCRAEVADDGGHTTAVLLLPPPPTSVGLFPSRISLSAAAGVEAIVLLLQVLPPSLHGKRFPLALPNLAARFRTLMPVFRSSLPL
ncbi:expressed unknown protein [Ectocarpus siliculosus]|uniref:Uncharacterized protein n=1 Tax=Ectocarpus siliculosus TaxID=2880 RepID=D8LMD0_ECTSI|nr:expressed unknown protein [Ectocarpus siliculosus]|eukprot:CBN77540.1 expressed unknown protein [Ectocarpus siliculosus]